MMKESCERANCTVHLSCFTFAYTVHLVRWQIEHSRQTASGAKVFALQQTTKEKQEKDEKEEEEEAEEGRGKNESNDCTREAKKRKKKRKKSAASRE